MASNQAAQVSSVRSNYKYLPYYLYEALLKARQNEGLNEQVFNVVRKNLIRMTIKNVPYYSAYSIALLFRMDIIWFLRYRNLKLLLKKMLSRRGETDAQRLK